MSVIKSIFSFVWSIFGARLLGVIVNQEVPNLAAEAIKKGVPAWIVNTAVTIADVLVGQISQIHQDPTTSPETKAALTTEALQTAAKQLNDHIVAGPSGTKGL